MTDVITQHLDVWTSALINKSTAGRGTSDKQTAYGIKKLRELILELAVRGKLVPQDPDDEPANILLDKIDEEKSNLLKSGEIKKQFSPADIEDTEIPFFLPKGWEWSRIGNIGRDWGQKTPTSDFTYIDVSSINNNLGLITTPEIVNASNAPSRARKIVTIGTVIYSTVRPYLKNICVIENEYLPEPIASTAFAILHPLQNMPGRFFSMYFRSPSFVAYVESVQNGIAYPAINDKQFFNGLVPIPPLNEQHRIAAKVDELMALCDQLEQQQTDSIAAHQTLVQTLLGTLTQAADAAEFEQAWSRIADHFDTLFTTEHSIEKLKKILLQLAVTGLLTNQKMSDVKSGIGRENKAIDLPIEGSNTKVTKPNFDKNIHLDEIPFKLPENWTWTRLGKIVDFIGGSQPPKSKFNDSPMRGYTRLIQIRDFKSDDYPTYVPDEFANRPFSEDDIMVGRYGPPVFQILRGKSGTYNVALMKAKPIGDSITKNFLYYLLSEPRIQELVISESERTAGQSGVRKELLHTFVVGLPPIEEQHRIAAKVDELLAICDTLKARIAAAQTTQLQLADAIVEEAIA